MQNMSSVRFVSGGIKRRILKTNRDFLGGVLKKEAYYIDGGGGERENCRFRFNLHYKSNKESSV